MASTKKFALFEKFYFVLKLGYSKQAGVVEDIHKDPWIFYSLGNLGINKNFEIHKRFQSCKSNASIGIRKHLRIYQWYFIFCLVSQSVFYATLKERQELNWMSKIMFLLSYHTFHSKYDYPTILDLFMISCFTDLLFMISKW